MVSHFFPRPVPYYAQIANPELAEAIFIHGMDPVNDPHWALTGAESPAEYAYWVERACGVACLKMAVEAFDGPQYSLVEWAKRGLARGGYLIRQNEDGTQNEIGWTHRALAEMAVEVGLHAIWKPAHLIDILNDLLENRLVIASVSYEAGDDRLPITKKGGHLMVVCGADYDENGPHAFYVNNPSGRLPHLQAGARLPIERFAPAYAGRVIVIAAGNKKAERT